MRESQLYEKVEQFVSKQFGCLMVGTDRGTEFGRMDVVGVREIEGDLASNFEIIGVEVKQAEDKFLNSAGQAKGYSIYANRCYLAKEDGFSEEEMEIARVLGIGLVEVRGRVREILSSPLHTPSPVWQRKVLRRLDLVECTICGTIFPDEETTGSSRSSKEAIMRSLKRALERNQAYRYFLFDYNKRHKSDSREYVHQKRYVCKDCLQALFKSNGRET